MTTSAMTDHRRAAIQLLIQADWMEPEADYAAAGKPFGEGRGLDLWLEFGLTTTVN